VIVPGRLRPSHGKQSCDRARRLMLGAWGRSMGIRSQSRRKAWP
jgi:hypothetical protein